MVTRGCINSDDSVQSVCRHGRLVALTLIGITGCAFSVWANSPPNAAIPSTAHDLITKLDRLTTEAANTPGHEAINFLRTPPRNQLIERLRRGLPLSPSATRKLMVELRRNIRHAEQGATWPIPPIAHVPRLHTPLITDGKLTDAEWQHALRYTESYPFNRTDATNAAYTRWYLGWDQRYLYVAWDCEDHDLLAEKRTRDAPVFMDDCVEILIMPDKRYRTYWELVISPTGSIFDSIQCKRINEWGATIDPAENIDGMRMGIDVRGTLNRSDDTDNGYTVEVAIPFSQLPGYTRTGPRAGHRLHFMLVRIDKTGNTQEPYAYQPLLSWGHNIWNHGVMELTD